jgi:hypothetical protein
MKKALLCVSLALATIGGISTLLQAQTTPTSAAPTTPVPMETPDPKLYGIPKATPVGMPAYTISPSTGSATVEPARRPMTAGDCDNGRWQSYSVMSFKSQASCRAWVRQHSSGTTGAQTAVTRSPATTPRARRTPAMKAPSGEPTPGSSITPFLAPTPNPR